MNETSNSAVTVLALDTAQTRDIGDNLYRRVPIQAEELALNINLFLGQMSGVLSKTPEEVGDFHLSEVTVSAEITGKGQVVLCGIGGEVGLSGGLQFVFKRGV